MGILENIFACKLLVSSNQIPDSNDSRSNLISLPEVTKLIAERRQDLTSNSIDNQAPQEPNLDYSEIVSEILTEVLIGMTKKIYPLTDTKLGKNESDKFFCKCFLKKDSDRGIGLVTTIAQW